MAVPLRPVRAANFEGASFSESERERAARIWPIHVDGDGAPNAARPAASGGATPAADSGLPVVGMAYLWDGAHMVAEARAPRRLHHLGRSCTMAFRRWRERRLFGVPSAARQVAATSSKTAEWNGLGQGWPLPRRLRPTRHTEGDVRHRGDLVWRRPPRLGEVRAVRTHGTLAAMSEHRSSPHTLACPSALSGAIRGR